MSLRGPAPPAAAFADEAFAVTADAYASAPDCWEQAVHAAIARLFDFLAEREDQTEACLLTGRAPADHDHVIDRFTTLLQTGCESTDAPPPVVTEAIGGGIYELVRAHVLEHRLTELPTAVPSATVVALSPFTGPERAIALVGSENVQSAS